MELEELLKDREYEEGEKRLERALVIAGREWEKVRLSLGECGDIGGFDKEDFMIGVIKEDVIIREPLVSPTKSVSFYAPTFYPMYFINNLLSMEESSLNGDIRHPRPLCFHRACPRLRRGSA
jgi:hypothetical protein